ncbi:type II toxin-antitoxin system HicA family toxin [Methanospirillum sp.]|uniref:type II toxin-antitoxin system HicA family toxin n=1 Tax=Methanospirillum sp. TaxID=45200 RepID=UPI002D1FA67C|nr:type II toxin-antitoxin system HicA family toxin [Methanospirillum sp.]
MSSQKGSHIKMKKNLPHRKVTLIIPIHDELDRGTLLGIIEQAGMTKEEFLSLFHNQ